MVIHIIYVQYYINHRKVLKFARLKCVQVIDLKCDFFFRFLFTDRTPAATNGTNNGAAGQLVPPPLTPGTNNKMTEALQATFASWEKERHLLNVPKGNVFTNS